MKPVAPTSPNAPGYPGYQNPCNGCGLCCLAEQCPISLAIYGPKILCPALVHVEERFACELMFAPLKHLNRDLAEPDFLAELLPDSATLDKWRFSNTLEDYEEMMAIVFQHIVGAGIGCDAQEAPDDNWPKATWDILSKATSTLTKVQHNE